MVAELAMMVMKAYHNGSRKFVMMAVKSFS